MFYAHRHSVSSNCRFLIEDCRKVILKISCDWFFKNEWCLLWWANARGGRGFHLNLYNLTNPNLTNIVCYSRFNIRNDIVMKIQARNLPQSLTKQLLFSTTSPSHSDSGGELQIRNLSRNPGPHSWQAVQDVQELHWPGSSPTPQSGPKPSATAAFGKSGSSGFAMYAMRRN